MIKLCLYGGVNMKKLKRSKENKIISGVCGGLGEYFNIDATIIRLAFVILAMKSFSSFFITYIICSMIIPEDDGVIYQENNNSHKNDNTALFLGLGLIVLGIILLGKYIITTVDHRLIYQLNYYIQTMFDLWPVLLIGLGIYILVKERKN